MTSETYRGRIRVVGPTRTGRMLAAILAPRGEGRYFVVTAHDCNAGERQRYRDVKGS